MWYEFKNKHEEVPELFIYDEIGENFFGEGVTARNLASELRELKNTSSINVRINSPGGSVFDGNAIYNALANHPAQVHVFVDGMALSAASIIAMAGDTVTMAENSMMMIHDPWAVVQGSAEDMESMADVLGKIKKGLVDTYHNKTSLGKRKIAAMMTAETWMTASEAVENGFADEISGQMKVAACAMPRHFVNAPENFQEFFGSFAETATDEPEIVTQPVEETPLMEEPKDVTGKPEETPQPEINADVQAELDSIKAKAEADIVAVIARAKALGPQFAVMAYEMRDEGNGALEIQSAIMDKHIKSRSGATPPAEPAAQPEKEPETAPLSPEEAFNASSEKVAAFGSFENYEAYKRMQASGRIRSLSKAN